MSTSDWVKLVTIPFFTGVIGYLIDWTGLIMLFNRVEFHGRVIPGACASSPTLLPRKLQEIPGIMKGDRVAGNRRATLAAEDSEAPQPAQRRFCSRETRCEATCPASSFSFAIRAS